MVDVTTHHFRMLIRCISPLPVLWTEMTWDRSILSAGCPDISAEEQPVVLQLGGCCPERLARAAVLVEKAGYNELNLNCGCPATLGFTTSGEARERYGVRLMLEPELVARCCASIIAAVNIPLSVKCRLGVDAHDSFDELLRFVRCVSAAGVRHFVVHARKAILGLDTSKNRSVPPLRHDWVARLADAFPDLSFTVNGGIHSLAHAATLLRGGVVGAMVGRKARDDPMLFAQSGVLYGGGSEGGGPEGGGSESGGPEAVPSRREVLARYCAYADEAHASAADTGACVRRASQLVGSR